ncbi:MAG TPA: hypothetical protein VGR28_05735, partial [Candidatus Thermoplasmatota archaeon]|nr:hypothetical protein [Candidatus Thermoplasmatota archaeon]
MRPPSGTMRVRASCLLAVLVVASVAAPVALSAGLPQAGGAVTLYLRSLQAPFGSLGAVETLSDEPPVNTNDTARNVTASAAWFAVPGAPREFGIGDLAGTVTFQVVGSQLPVLGVSFQSDITYQLLKVAVNGTQVEVGNATSSFTTTFSAVDA